MISKKIKNFFQYKGFLSRSGILLILIAIFLTIVSFVKGIQILIFIPSYIIAIFLYSLYELYLIKNDLSFNFYNDKNGNNLKLFLKRGKKYNFIIASKSKKGEIEFLESDKKLAYYLREKQNYELYLYVFGSFDIFRKIIKIGSLRLVEDETNYFFYLSEKYKHGDDISKLDNLKTSLNQTPYVKIKYDLNTKKKDFVSFNVISNEKLNIIGYESLDIFHILLILLGISGLIIEWNDIFLNSILAFSLFIIFILRKKRGKINSKYKNIMVLIPFFLMLFLTSLNKDMSGPGSLFLIQILLVLYLFPKDFKNSFLFIFLILFVFVAISLFSNQIWFIIFFLFYIFISIYLLFFISGTESFDERKYKFGNNMSKIYFFKVFSIIAFFMFLFFIILPHGNKAEYSTTIGDRNDLVSGFNEEISLENIKNISENSRKVIVIENISNSQINNLGIEYFRGRRYNYFDGKKWNSIFKSDIKYFRNSESLEGIDLKIKYYLSGGRYIFMPAIPLKISNTKIQFGNSFDDLTILGNYLGINEPISLDVEFEIGDDGEIIDAEESSLVVQSDIESKVRDLFLDYLESIPDQYRDSAELLTEYVKNNSGFEYSSDDISIDMQDFLYGKKKGHCEYFASTLAIVLQYYGYNPTLVSGYRYGEYNDFASSFIVRENNAHTWIEIYNKEIGKWKVYDPTPGTISTSLEKSDGLIKLIFDVYDYIDIKWYTYVVNYTGDEQKKLYKSIIDNKFKIFFLFVCVFFVFKIFRFIKNIIYFIKLSKKEKILFLISHKYKTKNNALSKLRKDNKDFSRKIQDYVYGDKGDISYMELIKFLFKKGR